MKSCVIFLLNFIISLCAFAQGTDDVWTEDIESAWIRALNEQKLLLIYITNQGSYALTNDAAFRKTKDEGLIYASIPFKRMDSERRIIFEDGKFRNVYEKFIQRYAINEPSLCIINPADGRIEKMLYAGPFRNDVIWRIKRKMLANTSPDENQTQKLTLQDLNLQNGITASREKAYQYAKENDMMLILAGTSAIKKNNFFKSKNDLKNLLVCSTMNPDDLFLLYPAANKYMPLDPKANSEKEIKLAIAELRDPSYPKYSLNTKALLQSSYIADNFDSAVRKALKQNRLVYIEVSSASEVSGEWGRKKFERITTYGDFIALNIVGTNVAGKVFISDKRHSQIMGAKPLEGFMRVLYDPVSKKYGEILSAPHTETFKEELGVIAAEFKNPYSTKTKYFWGDAPTDEKSNK